MDRRAEILRHINKQMRGIEVAPWFAPLTAKRDGYDCRILDVFDKPTLIERARKDPNIPVTSHVLLEEVDFVGSATEIASLVPAQEHGTFDYIVSSHNFEHLPDPIRFLQGCQKVLRPDGHLSMVIPDYRACFDFFRPHTTLIDWLEAYAEQRARPSRAQVFAMNANQSALTSDGRTSHAFSLGADATAVACNGSLDTAYATWRASTAGGEYNDAHCSVMSPASFELLISECRHLGLLTLEIDRFAGPNGCEFYVHLVNREHTAVPVTPAADFNVVRTKLMQRIWNERAVASGWGQRYIRGPKRLNSWLHSAERRVRKAIKNRLHGGNREK